MQESTIKREKWQQFWRIQTVSQALLVVLRLVANVLRFRLVRKYFTKGRILEVGCGTARASVFLARNRRQAELVGVDFSKRPITIANNHSKNYRINGSFILAEANSLPFKHESFDLVWSAGFLEHFQEPHGLVKEMARVIKRNGVVLAIIPTYDNLLVKARDFMKRITGYHFEFKTAWGGTRAYRVDLKDVFRKAHLHDVEIHAIPSELLIEMIVIGWKR